MKYRMHRLDKQINSETEMAYILEKGKYAVISMCRDNEPYLVSLNYGYDPEENALYFHCANQGLKLEFITANPNVCAAVVEDHSHKCAHDYQSVVIRGSISLVGDLAGKKKGMDVISRHLDDSDIQLGNDFIFDKITILRLAIHEITGRKSTKGSG